MNTIHNSIERRNYLQFTILTAQRVGLNKADAKGLTPLMKVSHEPEKKHATEMLRLLLQQSPRLDVVDRKGRNALMHAALVGNSQSLQRLLDAGYFDPAMRDYSGNAAIHYGSMSGDLPTLEILLDHLKKYRVKADLRNDQGMTPLHMACSQGHVEAARFLQREAGCSLNVRDGIATRTAREWLDTSCDIPAYMDPFGRDADISLIKPKSEPIEEEIIDNAQVRIFLYMKEKPEIDSEINEDLRPPWDISTKVEAPPKYLKSGKLNPARFRPGSAQSCRHFKGISSVRPFSAPCGYPEFSSWKHPLDLQPYLAVSEMDNFRKYSSVTNLSVIENSIIPKGNRRLLSARSSNG